MVVETYRCPTHGRQVTYQLVGGLKLCDAEWGTCGQLLRVDSIDLDVSSRAAPPDRRP